MTKSLSDAYWSDEPFEAEDDDIDCTRCGGTGFCPVDDFFFEDHDEIGEAPCRACSVSDQPQQTTL